VIIVAHHLVIDLVSWRIITSEINQAIKNSTDNFIVDDKKNKTANIKDWSDYLENTIKKNLVENELDYWKSQIIDKKAFPKDRNSESKTYFEDSVFYHTTALSMELTDSLIHEANTPFNTKVEDLLIAVVIKTLCEWADLDQVLLGLERQGRNIDTEEIDVSNTAGWFTSFFPKNAEALIDYCKTQGGINYTPSDFPEADLNQDDLDNLLNQLYFALYRALEKIRKTASRHS